MKELTPRQLDTLAALSLPAEKQVAWINVGCPVCDLCNDFDSEWQEREKLLDPQLHQIIQAISEAMDALKEEEKECFSPEVLSLKGWVRIREIATEALSHMKLEVGEIPSPTEDPRGVSRQTFIELKSQPVDCD